MTSLFALLMSLISAAFAHASLPSLKPAPNEPVCLVRQYSASHMAQNSKQKLSAIYVLLADKFYTTENPTDNSAAVMHYTSSNVIGLSQGKFYGNDQAQCEFQADGSARCRIDCDGGSFGLYPRGRATLMQVTKDYYFPLYLGGYKQDSSPNNDVLSFGGNDTDNNAYLLQTVPAQECERAIQEMQQADFGC